MGICVLDQKIGQPELLKEINRSRVIKELQSVRLISRAELAKRIGLSRPTVAVLANELMQAGLLQETGIGDSTGGRPPILMQFNPSAAFALGARMRDREWGIVLTDLDAQVVAREKIPIQDDSPQAAVDALQAGIGRLTAAFNSERILPAIGLGTPGLVDMSTGVVKTAVDVGWFEVPIGQMVENALGLRTFVANRSKVGALAEFWHGAKDEVRNLIYISIGTGVAAGVVIEGNLYVGANSSAGELGHITVVPDGPLCPCGNRGCLQQLISGPAIANRAREALRRDSASLLSTHFDNHPERITGEAVFWAAEQQDSLALSIVDEVTDYLGIAIANLVNLFNPERIVIGGPIGLNTAATLETLIGKVRRRAMAYPLSATEITTSTLGADTGSIGAAVLVLQQANELIFAEY